MPIYRLMFSTGMLFGFPPDPVYLDTYAHLHSACDPHTPLMIAGLDVDILPLIPHAVEKLKGSGNPIHVRTGMEDAPLGTKETNETLVRKAVEAIKKAGGEIASSGEVRADLLALGEQRSVWLEGRRKGKM